MRTARCFLFVLGLLSRRGFASNSSTGDVVVERLGEAKISAILEGVPVIDIGSIIDPATHTREAKEAAAAAIAKAAQGWGFFIVINHGVQSSLIARLRAASAAFFALPPACKDAVRRTATNYYGYFNDEFTKQTLDWKEGLDIGARPYPELGPDHPDNRVEEPHFNRWPSEEDVGGGSSSSGDGDSDRIVGFRQTVDEYTDAVAALAAQLMGALALGLGLEEDAFREAFRPQTSFLRLNHYPPCPEGGHFAVNHHTDAGALTVLLQDDDVVSLQVNWQQRGKWVSIAPVPNAFTINIGDMMQVWSNDLYRAPEHRVLTQPSAERFSAPFFYNPSTAADVAPLAACAACMAAGSGSSGGDDGRGGSAAGEGAGSGGNGAGAGDGGETGETGGGGGNGAGGGGGICSNANVNYKKINWGEFRHRRFEGDYADVGTEVQIEHYRLTV